MQLAEAESKRGGELRRGRLLRSKCMEIGGKARQGRAKWPLHPSSNNCGLVIELHTGGNQTWSDLAPITRDMADPWPSGPYIYVQAGLGFEFS